MGYVDQYGYKYSALMEDGRAFIRVRSKIGAWLGDFKDMATAEMFTYYRGKELQGK